MRPSGRLIEAISKVPLFSGLDDKGLEQVSQAAQVIVANQGKTIIKQGDRDRSMFIILDGKVRVFTYDNEGKQIQLAILSENQFFGEISLLSGVPRTATVQAVEETLLCKLKFAAIREICQSSPLIKATLEQYYRERVKDAEATKTEAGFIERRKDPHYVLGLPVKFSVSSGSPVSDQFRGKRFSSTSTDVSLSGIRVRVEDPYLQNLPMGCQLHLEISLTQPWGPIRCLGTLRNTSEGKDGQGFWSLGIEFTEMIPSNREKLEQFLSG